MSVVTVALLRAFFEASRRSSGAVLEALDRSFRTLVAGVDSVLVFTPASDELACIYAGGSRVDHLRRLRLRCDDATCLPAIAARLGQGARLSAGCDALVPTDRFAVAVPMLDERALLAVAYVSSMDRLRPTRSHAIVEVIDCAAAPYAMALEREADRADAARDGLTGLLSSRAFRRQLRSEVERAVAARCDCPISLWFVDTDRFKEVNDHFGHSAGDGVLQEMSSLLKSHLVAGVDLVARNGGDEFCALLRGVSKRRAIERAQEFCDAVRAHDFGLPVRITASIGIAAYPGDATSSSALLEAADAAMYHSKRNGRDQVSFVGKSGAFALLRSEAASEVSRTSSRCRSHFGESYAQRWPP